jgi:hypothetical protein
MKLAIMQPYLFPYVGYFQLINSVETFVVYDDVNFISQGWINRNNILVEGRKHRITLQVRGASSFKLINELSVGGNKWKMLKTIAQSYAKAPFFNQTFPVVEEVLTCGEENLARFIHNSICKISEYLDMSGKFTLSSGIEKDNSLKGQHKILEICRLLGADTYINAIGGKALYSVEEFRKNGIDLYFLRTREVRYRQFGAEFVPNLSIIDVLMFNSKEKIKSLLSEYDLVQ